MTALLLLHHKIHSGLHGYFFVDDVCRNWLGMRLGTRLDTWLGMRVGIRLGTRLGKRLCTTMGKMNNCGIIGCTVGQKARYHGVMSYSNDLSK